MKVIIAGSRGVTDYDTVKVAVFCSGFTITEVISGGARGVDEIGEQLAKDCDWPVKRFLADWKKHGRAAGPIRNREMAAYADALVAIWDGSSPGTRNMIDEAKARGLRFFVYQRDSNSVSSG